MSNAFSKPGALRVGDRVRRIGQHEVGEVVEIDGNYIYASFCVKDDPKGGFTSVYLSADQVELVEGK
jgi:hypothetical protein